MQKTLDERAITNKPFDYDIQLSLKCQAKTKERNYKSTNPPNIGQHRQRNIFWNL